MSNDELRMANGLDFGMRTSQFGLQLESLIPQAVGTSSFAGKEMDWMTHTIPIYGKGVYAKGQQTRHRRDKETPRRRFRRRVAGANRDGQASSGKNQFPLR